MPKKQTLTKREARAKRDREDFIRATTQAIANSGNKIPLGSSTPGANAGNTYREHLENELRKMVRKYDAMRDARVDPGRVRAQRGIIRGLAMALALYENSYDYTVERIKQVEEDFL
jgi:hypothetical protein